MDLDPSRITRAMDVDLGVGLGDLMGVGLGDDGFDDLFAPNANTSDFLKFCALDDAQQEQGPALTAPPSPGSSNVGTSAFALGDYDFAHERNNRGQAEIAQWELTTAPVPMMHPGKPRGRKRHDEDDATEATEAAHPLVKRRSSLGSVLKVEHEEFPPPATWRRGAPAGSAAERPRTVDSQAVALATLETGAKSKPVFVGQGADAGVSAPAQNAPVTTPAGGAIKVKKDLMSTRTRPRISVFMSASARRGGPKKRSASCAPSLDDSPRLEARSPLVSAAAPPGSYGHPSEVTPGMSPSLSSQRIKDLRIMVRARSQEEQQVVESNPPVVAMGSRHSSSALLIAGSSFGVPRLHRASSVGALTIAGSGNVFSRSPVLSDTGSIIQSCELSERGGGGSQRRLVCKVFGSGSPFSRPNPGPSPY